MSTSFPWRPLEMPSAPGQGPALPLILPSWRGPESSVHALRAQPRGEGVVSMGGSGRNVRARTPHGDCERCSFPRLQPPHLPFWISHITGGVSFPKMDYLEVLWDHTIHSQASGLNFFFF